MSQNFDRFFFAHLKREFKPHLRGFFGTNWDKSARDYDLHWLRKEPNLVRASAEGRDELAAGVQRALSLGTKKEAEHVINTVIQSLETTLLNHLGTNGFALKLNGFGKFYVRHRPGTRRKIGFSGKTIQTKMLRKVKFITLGLLRKRERVD